MSGRASGTTGSPITGKTPQTAKQVVAAVCGEGWQSAFDHFAPGPTKGVKPVPGGPAIEEDVIIVTGERSERRSRGILGWFADRLGDLADMAGLNGIGGQYRTGAGYNPTFNALASTGAVLNEQQGQVQTWVAEHPRVMGAVQMVGGGLQLTTAVVSGGAAVVTSETGVGAVAFGSLAVVAGTNGADNFQAGWRTLWSGVPTETYTHAALRSTGLSNTQASWGEAIIGVGSGFGVAAVGREGLEQLAVSGAQRNAARAWAAGPRTFTSTDPLVADLANDIERLYPGQVIGPNQLVGPSGELGAEVDILLRNAAIQVKSGRGASATSQALATQGFTDLPVIVYGPDLGLHLQRGLRTQGVLVTTDRDLLLEVVRP